MNVLERFFSGCRSAADLEQLLEVVADLVSATGPRVRLTIETWPEGACIRVYCAHRTEFASPEEFGAQAWRMHTLADWWSHSSWNGEFDELHVEIDWPVGEVVR